MTNILETVARAIAKEDGNDYHSSYKFLASAAITAFLEGTGEQGWHMRPDEATQEMEAEMKQLVYKLFTDWQEDEEQLRSVYPKLLRATLAAAPEFNWLVIWKEKE